MNILKFLETLYLNSFYPMLLGQQKSGSSTCSKPNPCCSLIITYIFNATSLQKNAGALRKHDQAY